MAGVATSGRRVRRIHSKASAVESARATGRTADRAVFYKTAAARFGQHRARKGRCATADQEDVRRIALALPEVSEAEDHFGFGVRSRGKPRGFVWAWNERVQPKRPRVPRPDVLAVRVADLVEKEMLLASDPEKFFTEPHYNGFPAVLVRLPEVGVDELRELIVGAWRAQAPAALVEAYDRGGAAPRP
jgi:hypothetical protein